MLISRGTSTADPCKYRFSRMFDMCLLVLFSVVICLARYSVVSCYLYREYHVASSVWARDLVLKRFYEKILRLDWFCMV